MGRYQTTIKVMLYNLYLRPLLDGTKLRTYGQIRNTLDPFSKWKRLR